MGTGEKSLKLKKRKESLKLFTLSNKKKTQLQILNFGATIFSLNIRGVEIIVGPSRPEDYLSDIYRLHGRYFGATVGRYAGRISKGGFEIDNKKYSLFGKDGVHLHGGELGLSYKFWKIVEKNEEQDPYVVLEYISVDGEEGYPGNLRLRVKYTLTEEDVLRIEYSAETDRKTIVNLTNHAYINLNGEGDINQHLLQIPAREYLEVDSFLVPTGMLLKTQDTPFNFTSPKTVGELDLDTTFCLEKRQNGIFLKGDKSGIGLTLKTNQPAVVVYVPTELPGDWEYLTKVATSRAAICLETQSFPDAVHHDHFPAVELIPGEKYSNKSEWYFN